jgi:hypothetical protein
VLKRAARRADAAPVVQQLVDFMDGMPPLPVILLYAALVGPALVVVHELGHASMALWRSTGPVVVRIAASRRRLALRSGRFQIEADALTHCGGICAYDPTGLTRFDEAAIALAGPAASLAGALVTALLWGHTGGPFQDLLAVATLGGVFGGVVNALPLTYRASKRDEAPVVRLDGLHALDALRRPRVPEPRPGKAGPVAGSVPPPGR